MFSRKIVFLILVFVMTQALSQAATAQFATSPASLEIISVGDREYTLKPLPEKYFAERISHYNQTIDKAPPRKDIKLTGHIIDCTDIIDLPVGTARGNHSYGGYCTLRLKDGSTAEVKICDDEITGKWFMSGHPSPHSQTSKKEQILELAQFTIKHCYGG